MGVKGFGYIGECTKIVGEKPEAKGFLVVVLSEETSEGQRYFLEDKWSLFPLQLLEYNLVIKKMEIN
jgi:hypothetical protein